MQVWLENAYSRIFAGFHPNDVTHRPNPKKDHPWAEPRHLSHKPRISVERFELGVGARKKTGQDKTGKKVTKGYISPVCGEAPLKRFKWKKCLEGNVLDVITVPSFKMKFSGLRFYRGSNSPFSCWFLSQLTTVQSYCAACDAHKFLIDSFLITTRDTCWAAKK